MFLDATTIQEWLTVVVGAVQSGLGVWAATGISKYWNVIKLDPKNKAMVLQFAGMLSMAATVVAQMGDGKLMPQSLTELVSGVLGFVLTWVTAHSAHKVVKGAKELAE